MFNKKIAIIVGLATISVLTLSGCTSASNTPVTDDKASSTSSSVNTKVNLGAKGMASLAAIYDASLAKINSEGLIENGDIFYNPNISKDMAVLKGLETNRHYAKLQASSITTLDWLAKNCKATYDGGYMFVSEKDGTYTIDYSDVKADDKESFTKLVIQTSGGVITGYSYYNIDGEMLGEFTVQYGGFTEKDIQEIELADSTKMAGIPSEMEAAKKQP